jgi:hypothetical protein
MHQQRGPTPRIFPSWCCHSGTSRAIQARIISPMNLSRVSGSFVIARNTAFTFKGKDVDAKEIGKQLGVRYVLKGPVRRDRGRVRVTLSQSRGAWRIISLCFLLSLKPPNTTKPSKIRDVLNTIRSLSRTPENRYCSIPIMHPVVTGRNA